MMDFEILDVPVGFAPERFFVMGCAESGHPGPFVNFVEIAMPGESVGAAVHAPLMTEIDSPTCTARVVFYDGQQVYQTPPALTPVDGRLTVRWGDFAPADQLDLRTRVWMGRLDQGIEGAPLAVGDYFVRVRHRDGPDCALPAAQLGSNWPSNGYVYDTLTGEAVRLRAGRFRLSQVPMGVEVLSRSRESEFVMTVGERCTILPGLGPLWVQLPDPLAETIYVVHDGIVEVIDPLVVAELRLFWLDAPLWSLPVYDSGEAAIWVKRDGAWLSASLDVPDTLPAVIPLPLDQLTPSEPPAGLIE